MKYYIVNEDELERLHGVGFSEGVLFCGRQGPDYDYQRFESEDNGDLAMGACRAREVDFWVLTEKEK